VAGQSRRAHQAPVHVLSRLRRRRSCSPPPALTSRQPGASAVAARAAGASRVALARKRRACYPTNKGRAAREAAFRIEPRAPASPAQRRGRTR